MNKFSCRIVLAIFMSMIGTNTHAYDFSAMNSDGRTIYYKYCNDGKDLEVAYGDYLNGNIVIPEEVTYMDRTRKVVSIGDDAFAYCRLDSLIIPNSVTTIGKRAFYYGQVGHLILPNSLTSFGEDVFNTTNLGTVSIPDVGSWCKIKFGDIYSNPLYYATYVLLNGENFGRNKIGNIPTVEDIIIPDGVTSIEDYAFIFTTDINSLEIPNSVTYIGKQSLNFNSVKKVVSKIEQPFEIIGKSIYDRTFTQNTFNNATLYVPKGTLENYKETDGWKDFFFIEEESPTSIRELEFSVSQIKSNGISLTISGLKEGTPISVYDTAGQMVGYTVASAGTIEFTTSLQRGEIGIVKIGEKSVKILMK